MKEILYLALTVLIVRVIIKLNDSFRNQILRISCV